MNEIKKSLMLRFLIGFILGMIIGALFYIVAGVLDASFQTAEVGDIIICLISCGIYGAVCTCAMILYKIESISLVYATAIHFLIVMGGLYVLGLVLGWEFDNTIVMMIFMSYLLIFIISWNIMYYVGKRKAKKMNKTLQEWKAYREKTKGKEHETI